MKVVRVTLTEFATEDGAVHPILPPLEHPMTLEEFQACYDRATQLVESIQDAGGDDDDHPGVGQRRKGAVRPQRRWASTHSSR